MKGDFSKWRFEEDFNLTGVLQQQGRVLLDEDWNAQTRITNQWQDTAARDTVGPGVAAVPSDTPTAFQVSEVDVEGDRVNITLLPGRIWADGILVHLPEDAGAREFTATEFESSDEARGPGVRDAVVLEVWREELNGFQLPEALIEPALGGPDTTERMHTAMALRLLRLDANDTCENIRHRLQEDFLTTGRLTVTLDPTTPTEGDCPTVEQGGFTGFEHSLYRIEIARVNDDRAPMFKWSQFNGGLVGSGQYQTVDGETSFTLEGNDQAIRRSGMNRFYLEVIEEDGNGDDFGHWRVTYGAMVVLDGDRLVVEEGQIFYEYEPGNSRSVFFRLWNGIEPIADFDASTDPLHPLEHGLRLGFQTPSSAYNPGDYWTFSVRAGQSNPETLVEEQLPDGIKYHRVPLAQIHWTDGDPGVEYCRRIIRPLTSQLGCCSYSVGTDGDFRTLQEAVDAFTSNMRGGEICLLPGFHRASVRIENKFNIRIKGCGLRTLVVPDEVEEGEEVGPIFHILNSGKIVLENMLLVNFVGKVIETVGGGWHNIENNTIFALRHAIHIHSGLLVNIHHDTIFMLDREEGGDVAVFSSADDVIIERNKIVLIPYDTASRVFGEGEGEDWVYNCLNLMRLQEDEQQLPQYIGVFLQLDFSTLIPIVPVGTRSGIQIGSGSERIKIIENRIQGGSGNGITLGSTVDPETLTPVTPDLAPGPITPHPLSASRPITPINNEIWGTLLVEGRPPPQEEDIVISLKHRGHLSTHKVGPNGAFNFTTEIDDEHELRILTMGYAIEDTVVDSSGGLNIYLRRIDDEVDDEIFALFAPMREIVIQGNEISNMGLSGIGTPQTNLSIPRTEFDSFQLVYDLAHFFGVASGFIYDLLIQKNHISRCLQTEFSGVLSALLASRGEGGVSLGLCENVVIRENRIERNGKNHNQPVCGVFISGATQADIHNNDIVNNGPLDVNAGLNLQQGIRGGVIIRLATAKLTNSSAAQTAVSNVESGPNTLSSVARAVYLLGGNACRVHDNLIKQPVGQALRISL